MIISNNQDNYTFDFHHFEVNNWAFYAFHMKWDDEALKQRLNDAFSRFDFEIFFEESQSQNKVTDEIDYEFIDNLYVKVINTFMLNVKQEMKDFDFSTTKWSKSYLKTQRLSEIDEFKIIMDSIDRTEFDLFNSEYVESELLKLKVLELNVLERIEKTFVDCIDDYHRYSVVPDYIDEAFDDEAAGFYDYMWELHTNRKEDEQFKKSINKPGCSGFFVIPLIGIALLMFIK